MVNSKSFASVKTISIVALVGMFALLSGCANQNLSSSETSSAVSSSISSSASSLSVGVPVSDVKLLSDIGNAKTNKGGVTVSLNGSELSTNIVWATPAVIASYNDAISLAQSVADNADATQTNVDNAVTALASATLSFNVAKAFGTKSSAIQAIDLGSAGAFVALAKTGVSTTGTTAITGNVGVSPAAATYLTGFSLIADPTNAFATSSYVTGSLYASDYAVPTPTYLIGAVSAMELAFTVGIGKAPNFTELYSGNLSGQTLTAGVYKWGTDVLINTDVTLTGSATDTWIFQISDKLTEAENMHVILSGGALSKNIFWFVSDTIAIGAGAHVEGTILDQVDISMGTGSSINGRLLSQSAISLDAATLVYPS